jgi:hypothetical protein
MGGLIEVIVNLSGRLLLCHCRFKLLIFSINSNSDTMKTSRFSSKTSTFWATMLVCTLLLLATAQLTGQATMKLNKEVFGPGESITLTFTAASSWPGDAWIGILPSEIGHGSEATNDNHELTYQYINRRTSGTMTFTAPDKPGSYDFRMHNTDNNGREIAYVSFSVGTKGDVRAPVPGPSGSASLRLDRTSFTPGEDITVYFSARPPIMPAVPGWASCRLTSATAAKPPTIITS